MRTEMQPKLKWFYLVPMCVAIAACSAVTPPQSEPKTVPNMDTAGRPVADEIAKFAVNTPPGQTGTVMTKNQQRVQVYVGMDYISATKQKCRAVRLGYSDGQTMSSAVCFDGSVWKTIIAQ